MPAATKLQGFKGFFYFSAGDTVTTNAATVSASAAITVVDPTGIAVGDVASGTGIFSGSTVVSISGDTVTLSHAATADGSAVAITFTPPASAKLAHCAGWDITIKADNVDATDHDTIGWKDNMDGLRDWSGTIDAMYFTNSATQLQLIDAILAGSVDINGDFRPLDQTGEVKYTGTLRITDCKLGAKGSTAQAVNLSFTGRGALTRAAIA